MSHVIVIKFRNIRNAFDFIICHPKQILLQ